MQKDSQKPKSKVGEKFRRLKEERRAERKRLAEEMDAKFETLRIGDILSARVVSIAPYGVFVDVGYGLHGLVHVSEVLPEGLTDLQSHFSCGNELRVMVTSLTRRENNKPCLALSMKRVAVLECLSRLEVGGVVSGTVTNVRHYGCFVRLDDGPVTGLLHHSKYSHGMAKKTLSTGDRLQVRIIELDAVAGRVGLSAQSLPQRRPDSDQKTSN